MSYVRLTERIGFLARLRIVRRTPGVLRLDFVWSFLEYFRLAVLRPPFEGFTHVACPDAGLYQYLACAFVS
jgi:hypothetical protein